MKTKPIKRFATGYLVGALLVGIWMIIAKGDSLKNPPLLVLLWLPITAVYCALAIVLLRRLKLIHLAGILELCGVCVGLFPPFCGLWPTYAMRWDLALELLAFQWVVLSVVVLLRALFEKLRTGHLRPPDEATDGQKLPH